MKPIDIIMINMSSYAEWQHGVSNRNYHILRELSQSDRVGKIIAVDYPPLTFKRALRNHKENIITSVRQGTTLARSPYDKLTKISDKLFVYSNVEFWLRPRHFIERLKQVAQTVQLNDFIAWSFFPLIMEQLQGIGQKLTVFDAVDNWSEHASYVQFKDRLKKDYRFIKDNADIIFTVAEDLQKLFDNQQNVYWIPNGVDLSHYQNLHRVIKRDISDIPKPIIGYIGVVQERVDIDLIKFLASKNPTKSFVIVGPVWHDDQLKSLKELPNIHVLGYKTYEEAPMYIQQFDVGIIPHRGTSFITSTNPMKMYEYLACGKPVVATKDSGVDMFKNLVYRAADPADFNRKLFRALEEDSEEKRQQRRTAVEEYSWNMTVRQMLDIVEKKLSY